jgi:hypothetical protein
MILTGKTSRDENPSKPTKTSDERRTRNLPIIESNNFTFHIKSSINEGSNDNEQNDGENFQR